MLEQSKIVACSNQSCAMNGITATVWATAHSSGRFWDWPQLTCRDCGREPLDVEKGFN